MTQIQKGLSILVMDQDREYFGNILVREGVLIDGWHPFKKGSIKNTHVQYAHIKLPLVAAKTLSQKKAQSSSKHGIHETSSRLIKFGQTVGFVSGGFVRKHAQINVTADMNG